MSSKKKPVKRTEKIELEPVEEEILEETNLSPEEILEEEEIEEFPEKEIKPEKKEEKPKFTAKESKVVRIQFLFNCKTYRNGILEKYKQGQIIEADQSILSAFNGLYKKL